MSLQNSLNKQVLRLDVIDNNFYHGIQHILEE